MVPAKLGQPANRLTCIPVKNDAAFRCRMVLILVIAVDQEAARKAARRQKRIVGRRARSAPQIVIAEVVDQKSMVTCAVVSRIGHDDFGLYCHLVSALFSLRSTFAIPVPFTM